MVCAATLVAAPRSPVLKVVNVFAVNAARLILSFPEEKSAMVSKFAIPFMKAKGGSIVNMGSQSGVMAQSQFATYNSSKGAIITLTKCMALDLAPYKIRVNSVNPGCILTSASYREIERLGMTFEQWRDKCAPMHMLNRLGEPREVANAVLFLASDEASFITAAALMVEGGSTAF